MKEVFLPSLADEENEVPENHKCDDAYENDVQAEEIHVPDSCCLVSGGGEILSPCIRHRNGIVAPAQYRDLREPMQGAPASAFDPVAEQSFTLDRRK
jgi:hypothetical protein